MDKIPLDNKWLPPSPHREEILKAIEKGQAYIEERGHNIPPLLVFEDEGGVIELPTVRYLMTRRGMQLVAAGDTSSSDQTKHHDVCGTVDELKGLAREQPDLPHSNPAIFSQLLDDACYMISRMQRRLKNYEEFRAEMAALCKRMTAIEGPDPNVEVKIADEIRVILRDSKESIPLRIDELDELAEGVRNIASRLESCLSTYKKAAIEVNACYEAIKGGRNWKTKEPNAS